MDIHERDRIASHVRGWVTWAIAVAKEGERSTNDIAHEVASRSVPSPDPSRAVDPSDVKKREVEYVPAPWRVTDDQ